jgi:hypothetical protein
MVVPRPWAGGKALTHAENNTFWFADIWLAPARGSAYLVATNRGDEEKGFAGCDAAVRKLLGWKPADAGPLKQPK